MDKIKSIGGVLLGVAAFIGIIIVTVLLFTWGAKLAFAVAPFIYWLAGILFFINIIVLLTAIIPSAREAAGIIIFISSYVYGLATWIYGLAVTLALWGWLAVIVGLLIAGIGVVPIGILAAIFNAKWELFWPLLITLALTYGARLIGALLMTNADNHQKRKEVIDIEPENNRRTWGDLE